MLFLHRLKGEQVLTLEGGEGQFSKVSWPPLLSMVSPLSVQKMS